MLQVNVSLHRRNANNNVRIMTPVFSKPKDEAWWLLVGLSSGNAGGASSGSGKGGLRLPSPQDELVSMRRVNNLRTRNSLSLKLPLPHSHGQYTYTVYLVSDSYLGFDQQHSFRVTIGGAAGAKASAAIPAQVSAAAAADDPDDIYN
jgi:pre-mRNA-splicing helicase BRR2